MVLLFTVTWQLVALTGVQLALKEVGATDVSSVTTVPVDTLAEQLVPPEAVQAVMVVAAVLLFVNPLTDPEPVTATVSTGVVPLQSAMSVS